MNTEGEGTVMYDMRSAIRCATAGVLSLWPSPSNLLMFLRNGLLDFFFLAIYSFFMWLYPSMPPSRANGHYMYGVTSFHAHMYWKAGRRPAHSTCHARLQNAISYSQLRDVCLSVGMEQHASHGTDFSLNLILECFSKFFRENSSFIKIGQGFTGTLHEYLCTFMISRPIF